MSVSNYSLHYLRWHRTDAQYYETWHRDGGRTSLPRLVGADRAQRVLDFGCGIGLAVHSLQASGYRHVQGLDADAHQVAVARQRGLPCEHVPPDAQPAYFAALETPYDTVLMSDVLEHVPKAAQIGLLAMIRGALARDGRLVIRTPNALGPMAACQRYIDFTHECSYTVESLEHVLAEAGFEAVAWLPNGRPRLDALHKLPWFLVRWAALLFSRAVWRTIYVGELGRPGWRVPLDRDLLVIARPRADATR